MAKQKNLILWIIGIVLVLLLINYYQKPVEPLGITVEYYKNGQKVSGLFGVFIEYDQIRLGIYATETEGFDLNNIQIVDATPQIFKDALPITIQTLKAGEVNKNLWNSDLIDTSELALLPQPVIFWVRIRAEGDIYKETSFSLTFVEEVGEVILLYTHQARLIWNADLAGESVEFENVKFDTFKDATKIDTINSEIDDIPVYSALVLDDFEDGIIDTNIWSWQLDRGVVSESDGSLGLSGLDVVIAIADQTNTIDFNQDCTIFLYCKGVHGVNWGIHLVDEHSNYVPLVSVDVDATNEYRFEVDPGDNNIQAYENDIAIPVEDIVSSLTDGDKWHIRFRTGGGTSRLNIYQVRYLLNSPVTKDFVSDTTTTEKIIENAILILDENGGSAIYYLSADNGIHWEQTELNKIHRFTNTGNNLKLKVTMTSSATQAYELNHYAIFYNLY